MAKQAIKNIKDIEDKNSSEDKNIIDEYRDLDQKLDRVLEKISARKNKSKK